MKKTERVAGKIGKGLKVMLCILLVGLAVLFAFLLYWSPGKIEPFLDEKGAELPGSIAEKLHVEINGVQQGMIIRGKSVDNPVLLFVHGGPGMPEYILPYYYDNPLEEIFTVCWWDQRGSGLSFDGSLAPEEVTLENLVSDAIGVTNYLRERFGQDKIYLMAHSWGTVPGIYTAQAAPELYHAYIGMAQISGQPGEEEIIVDHLTGQYRQQGNEKMALKLEEAVKNGSYAGSALRDKAMHELGVGTLRDMDSVITGVFLPSWQCRAYTIGEKINLWRGKFGGVNRGLIENMDVDLTEAVPRLEIPAYFFSGAYDYTVYHGYSKLYLEKLEAPVKGFYSFAESAHGPLFEEPEKAGRILREDVLAGSGALADGRQSIGYFGVRSRIDDVC